MSNLFIWIYSGERARRSSIIVSEGAGYESLGTCALGARGNSGKETGREGQKIAKLFVDF
jgi:hypothetical protein